MRMLYFAFRAFSGDILPVSMLSCAALQFFVFFGKTEAFSCYFLPFFLVPIKSNLFFFSFICKAALLRRKGQEKPGKENKN